MPKLLRHLLLVGVLFGLAGNGVAVAAPCILMTPGQPAAMADMPDCAMGPNCSDCGSKLTKSGKGKRDKGAPGGCMAMAGCSVATAVRKTHFRSSLRILSSPPRDSGRSLLPWRVASSRPSPNHPPSSAEPNRRRRSRARAQVGPRSTDRQRQPVFLSRITTMNNSSPAAGVVAALASLVAAPSAFAADAIPPAAPGHSEWRAQPSYGPRTPTRAPVRVWVSYSMATAVDCGHGLTHDSKAQAADCMAASQG